MEHLWSQAGATGGNGSQMRRDQNRSNQPFGNRSVKTVTEPTDVLAVRSDAAAERAGVLHRVVVVGGGFGGLQAVSKMRRCPVEVTLVDRRNFHLFQPLTYQVATGALSPDEIAYPLRAIFKRHRNVRVVMAEVADFDLAARELHLRPVAGVPVPDRLG
jgi:NADPH-dependent 2,4-dienoyl-CoA reductase/sulfur reductase-like enzyme